jgi:hypothetical protein
MAVREIPPDEWPRFLQDFSREHRAWLVTVDRCLPDIYDRAQAVQRPLDSVTADVSAGRVVRIEIRLQSDADSVGAVAVKEPTKLRVDETDEGMARGLEIDDARGECTRLRFRATMRPDALDGLAAGELENP